MIKDYVIRCSVWTLLIFYFVPTRDARWNDGEKAKVRWHVGENTMVRCWNRDVAMIRWWKRDVISRFIIVPSRFHYLTIAPLCFQHRTITFSPSCHGVFTVVPSRFNHFTIVQSWFHHRTIAFSPSCYLFFPSYHCPFTIMPSRFHNRALAILPKKFMIEIFLKITMTFVSLLCKTKCILITFNDWKKQILTVTIGTGFPFKIVKQIRGNSYNVNVMMIYRFLINIYL
jgi:hypothetical protein